eukprot:COSAG06_NODE_773_length_12432_cov_14.300332_3_plen_550_part_00
MARIQAALLAGLAAGVDAQRQTPPAVGEACQGCQCGATDLSSYGEGVFRTPADDDGYRYMFKMCGEIADAELPEGCQAQSGVPPLPHPAVVMYKDNNPLDCSMVGSFGPCESADITCGMTYQPLSDGGGGLAVTWQYLYGCQNTFRIALEQGAESKPTYAPYNDPTDPYLCYWTSTWASLGAFSGAAGGGSADAGASEPEPPTGVTASLALLFCYVWWVIFTVMMAVFAFGIPDRIMAPPPSAAAAGAAAGESRDVAGKAEPPRPRDRGRGPAMERALRFHQLARWQRQLITFQWAVCGNTLFILASLVYVGASLLNFQLTYFDVAWVGDYYFYDKLNLSGAIIFTIEPLIDILGAISSSWSTVIDQAHWETFGRHRPHAAAAARTSGSSGRSRSRSSSSSRGSSSGGGLDGGILVVSAANPLGSGGGSGGSGSQEGAAATAAAGGSGGGGSGGGGGGSGGSGGHDDDDPWSWLSAPLTPNPWWLRWQWRGYTVWESDGDAPSKMDLVLSSLDFYAACFFLLASLGYLWAAALPWMYRDFCMDTDGTIQ